MVWRQLWCLSPCFRIFVGELDTEQKAEVLVSGVGRDRNVDGTGLIDHRTTAKAIPHSVEFAGLAA